MLSDILSSEFSCSSDVSSLLKLSSSELFGLSLLVLSSSELWSSLSSEYLVEFPLFSSELFSELSSTLCSSTDISSGLSSSSSVLPSSNERSLKLSFFLLTNSFFNSKLLTKLIDKKEKNIWNKIQDINCFLFIFYYIKIKLMTISYKQFNNNYIF